ncbi:hypothetical protein ACSSS7_001652 [Eimeria intestinalis]
MGKALKKGGKKVGGGGKRGAPAGASAAASLGGPHSHGLKGGIGGPLLSLKRKAKTHKGRRVLAARESEPYPQVKRLLLLRGSRCTPSLQQLLGDLRDLKKPEAVFLSQRKQEGLHPFEDAEPIEYLTRKNACGLFAFASSSKKRPSRLVLGRVYEGQLLDMHEFAVCHYSPAAAFAAVQAPRAGSAPLVLLQGGLWESSECMQSLKNLFADFFRAVAAPPEGPPQQLFLSGLDRLVAISAVQAGPAGAAAAAATAATAPASSVDGSQQKQQQQSQPAAAAAAATGSSNMLVCIRHYRLVLRRDAASGKGGTGGPQVQLEEVGPQIDLKLDRMRLAAADRWRAATKTLEKAKAEETKAKRAAAEEGGPPPQGPPKKKSKNVKTNLFGDAVGRVFVDKPDLTRLKQIQSPMLLKVRKAEANQKKAAAASAAAASGAEDE